MGLDERTLTYTENLGITYARRGYGNPIDGSGENDTFLIYYPIGDSVGGTPYYNQPTGIDLIDNSFGVHLFPNPSNGTLHLSIDNFKQGYTFILSDVLGRKIFTQAISGSTTLFNISDLPAGIYICQLVFDGSIFKTEKVIKE